MSKYDRLIHTGSDGRSVLRKKHVVVNEIATATIPQHEPGVGIMRGIGSRAVDRTIEKTNIGGTGGRGVRAHDDEIASRGIVGLRVNSQIAIRVAVAVLRDRRAGIGNSNRLHQRIIRVVRNDDPGGIADASERSENPEVTQNGRWMTGRDRDQTAV